MILFYSITNLFYFILICVLCYTHGVMSNYIYEVLRCNEPLVSWQMEQPIFFFADYVNATDVISQGQISLALII